MSELRIIKSKHKAESKQTAEILKTLHFDTLWHCIISLRPNLIPNELSNLSMDEIEMSSCLEMPNLLLAPIMEFQIMLK